MEEILDAVCFELENSGYMDKLSAGIVITGGGALLKHLPQLVRFKTGMDVRVGYPNEYLASQDLPEVNHPMFSTAIGLLLKGFEHLKERNETIATNSHTKELIEQQQTILETEEVPIDGTKQKESFLESIKKTFSNIFEEDDIKM
jgi:cell division protein FtsA